MTRNILKIILLLSLITACQPVGEEATTPISPCNIVTQNLFQAVNYTIDREAETLAFLKGRFQLNDNDITLAEGQTVARANRFDYRGHYWSGEIFEHALYFRDAIALYSRHTWHNPPSAKELIDCLGAPDYYVAFQISQGRTLVELWYPAQGVILTAFLSDNELITETIEMDQLVYLQKPIDLHNPDSLNGFVGIEHQATSLNYLDHLKGWNSDWNGIVVEEIPLPLD